MSVTVDILLTLKALQRITDDMGVPTDSPKFTFPNPTQWASGTAAAEANALYHNRITLTGTNAQTLDLAGGVSDKFGNVLTFTKVKLLAIYNRATNVADIVTVGGGSNAWGAWSGTAGANFLVGPGGLDLKANPALAGFAVTAGTGDNLRLQNAATNVVTVDVMIAGIA